MLTCRMTTSGNDDHGDGGGREDDILVGTADCNAYPTLKLNSVVYAYQPNIEIKDGDLNWSVWQWNEQGLMTK